MEGLAVCQGYNTPEETLTLLHKQYYPLLLAPTNTVM